MKIWANWYELTKICIKHKPQSYLEIGVLSGESLEVVLDFSYPHPRTLTLCDSWSPEYKGSSYRNHDHIEQMLGRKGYKGIVRYLDGDSHELVKRIDTTFDLIHVDGDHSFDGALVDLRDSWPLLNSGGHLVLDDIVHAKGVERALNVFIREIEGQWTLIKINHSLEEGVAVLEKK